MVPAPEAVLRVQVGSVNFLPVGGADGRHGHPDEDRGPAAGTARAPWRRRRRPRPRWPAAVALSDIRRSPTSRPSQHLGETVGTRIHPRWTGQTRWAAQDLLPARSVSRTTRLRPKPSSRRARGPGRPGSSSSRPCPRGAWTPRCAPPRPSTLKTTTRGLARRRGKLADLLQVLPAHAGGGMAGDHPGIVPLLAEVAASRPPPTAATGRGRRRARRPGRPDPRACSSARVGVSACARLIIRFLRGG